MKVLFLGATGVVGSQVVPFLERDFELHLAAFGGGKVGETPVAHCDITDFAELQTLLQTQRFDAIINSAIAPHRGVDFSSDAARHAYYEQCIAINARGAYELFEAAWQAKVPRVVYISSLTALLGAPKRAHFPRDCADQPNDIYAASKVFGEHAGRYFAHRESAQSESDDHAMSVLCLRLGQPYPSFTQYDEIWPESAFSRGLMVHVEDIAQAIRLALCSPRKWGVFPVVSGADTEVLDLGATRELGYEPVWEFLPDGMKRRERP